MSFEAKKFNQLVADMRERSTVLSDFEVGSVHRTMVESFAYELALLYEKMNLVYLSAFVDSAEGRDLENVVAVLGVKRNLPDYATGLVTFFRDAGGADITIPAGTLVATEDTEEKPKKTYVTLNAAVLAAEDTEITLKVRAFKRGEDQVAAAQTINTVPRPVPGITGVLNQGATIFKGKKAETDDELRQRAKNTLSQSGGTIIAIENALLAEPGVKQVRVQELFHYARGRVDLLRTTNSSTAELLPKNTVIVYDESGNQYDERSFKLLDEVMWPEGKDTLFEVPVESVTAGREGEFLELGVITPTNWKVEGSFNPLTSVNLHSGLRLDEYGIIHVLLDGVDIVNNGEDLPRINAVVEQWRAAGIYAVLEEAKKVKLRGVFLISLNPSLNLSPEERRAYELEVEAVIRLFIDQLPMGEDLKFPQLIQQILAVDGVDNVEELSILIDKYGVRREYKLADKHVTLADDERFDLGDANDPTETAYVVVASEPKLLPVSLAFRYLGTSLNSTIVDAYKADLMQELNSSQGVKTITDVRNALTIANIDLGTFRLHFSPWSPRTVIQGSDILMSFVEEAIIDSAFIYNEYLDLTGAFKIKLPNFYAPALRANKLTEIQAIAAAFVDQLDHEENIFLDDLVAAIKGVKGVLEVDFETDDFRAHLNSQWDPTRVDNQEGVISVNTYEKARFAHLIVTEGVEALELRLSNIVIQVATGMSASDQLSIQTQVAVAFNNFSMSQGGNIDFTLLLSALAGAASPLIYTITTLNVEVVSQSDGRVQATNITDADELLVRTVELPTVQAILPNFITITTI